MCTWTSNKVLWLNVWLKLEHKYWIHKDNNDEQQQQQKSAKKAAVDQ